MATEGNNYEIVRSGDFSHRILKSLDSWGFQESQLIGVRHYMENMWIGYSSFLQSSSFGLMIIPFPSSQKAGDSFSSGDSEPGRVGVRVCACLDYLCVVQLV